MKNIFILILSSLILFSMSGCTSDNGSSSDNKTSVSQSTGSDDSAYDFSGIDSQKYADLLSHKNKDSQYTLKWSYDKKYEDAAINYICYDGKTGYWSLNMTQPLFNNVKFICKDHKIYDIYDSSKSYSVTDAKQSAMEMGYLTIEEFESYACDIFAGLRYVGSGTDKPQGALKEYSYDAFTTTKGVELWFLMNEDKSLYAIRAEYDDNETAYMYIEELNETSDENDFIIPEGYKENTESTQDVQSSESTQINQGTESIQTP